MDFQPLGTRFWMIFEPPELVFLSPASHLERHVWSVQVEDLALMIRATRGRSMDGHDLIICIAIWTHYKLWPPLVCDELRVISIASQNKLRFTSLLGLIFKDFGKPNGFPNSIFEAFFSMLFFIAFEHPILVDFSRLRTRKIVISQRKNNDFCKICVFD